MFHPQGPTLRELAIEALSSTRRGYDLLAPKFDHTPFRTPDAVLGAVAGSLAAAGPFGLGLDLCCGTGAATAMLRPHCRQVVGLDFSRGMLLAGRRQPALAGVELVQADALALPFGQTFDVVVSFGAFGHFLEREQPRMVAEVARVLRPGGRFVFVTATVPPAWSRRYWLGHAFNGAMQVRNRLVSPPFVMYYLTFLLPDALRLLREAGLKVETRDLGGLPGMWRDLRLVTATRDPQRGVTT
ncbi:MAG: class I SAM-dependent methyltransferase [Candidatus Dormibacteraeota bacterium]|nr:class I SAM-dependent methyltransferase [Candidatus Dormibacteraeota bacterium]